MEYIFFFLWLITSMATFILGIKIIKAKKAEKNTKRWKGIKSKVTNILKKKEISKSKIVAKQLKTFFIISIITSFMSFIAFAVTVPPMEQTSNNTAIEENSNKENIAEANNLEQEDEEKENEIKNNAEQIQAEDFTEVRQQYLSSIPAYSNTPYVVINNNIPFFNDSDLTANSYESYSNLDSFGRCGFAMASVGKDIMPTEERGSIGTVKPTGWHSVRYNGIDGNYLYNRCHLIGYQLTAENANEKNLITGTRYLNVEGMLPFENMVADYVKETGNHVLYRVTPIFEGNNLLASGVLMEAKSVEDNGKGVLFNVYCYNVQPGIEIDYATGESSGPEYTGTSTTSSGEGSSSSNTNASSNSSSNNVETSIIPSTTPVSNPNNQTTENVAINDKIDTTNSISQTYILNTNSKKFHETSCGSAARIKEANKSTFTGSRDELIARGYSPCGNCDP